MKHRKMNFRNLLTKKHFFFASLIVAAMTAGFVLYSISLFGEISTMMTETPGRRPSILYSDIFTIKIGDIFSNIQLRERLNDLKITLKTSGSKYSWRERKWYYPASLLAEDSPLRLQNDATIELEVENDRIKSIAVNGESRDVIAIEPTPIARLSASATEIREYLTLDEIPTPLLQAIIAIEDQRFLEHHGFDPKSLARAIVIDIKSGSLSQGGSTLTQQLVKNLLGTRQKTITRKIKELVLAFLIEFKYSKEKILEKYLNEIYFGQIGALEVHGVSEAARYFFNKSLSQLSLSECAVLAGVIRGPAYYSPYKNRQRTLERKNTVLKKMFELQLITKSEYDKSVADVPKFSPPLAGVNKAPYFVDFVKAQILEELSDKITAEDLSSQGLYIYTTLDIPTQLHADAAVAAGVKNLEQRYKLEGGPVRLESVLVSADHATGFVRALVGGRSYAETTFNRVLNMKRSIGSTFKPISYLAAFLKGQDTKGVPYTSAYMVDDEPWVYEYDDQKWSPKNYESTFRGHITLREAFVNSINIPMAKVAMDVGVDRIAELAEKLGIRTKLRHIPSLTLGSVELSPMEVLQVFSTFANRGESIDLTTVRVIEDANHNTLARYNPQSIQVVEPKFIDVLNELLHAVTIEGTAKSLPTLGYDKFAYGKTGTTNFSRDAWFTGFSQKLSTTVWVGFDEMKVPNEDDEDAVRKFKSPAPLTGAGAALPIWAQFYKANFPSSFSTEEPPMDSSLQVQSISRATGCLSSQDSPERSFEAHFISGTVPTCIDSSP